MSCSPTITAEVLQATSLLLARHGLRVGTGVGLSFARQVALSRGGDLIRAPAKAQAGASFLLTL